MISAKKLLKMARKWQKLASIKGKRITLPKATGSEIAGSCNTSAVADKGHFVVYNADERRFVLPLEYLNKEIFKELFRMAEEEFGLPRNGPITLPCDAACVEYVVAMIQQNTAKNLEKALAIAIATECCPSSSYLPPHLPISNQQILQICIF
ncbi:auxin-responsive protein SAUR68-like [Juglans microcarpa x Juglans regia]|uniref:auxin-responsive protein SAUR68-like n=1 Tax=Juglans microcarpa x Juglans regia TaxID=2249226 RepID=UPI001B7E2197|nr:auxin-responsive protein SAUR68-like [Juglans microcarpa x Juglans regia]